MGSGTKKKPFSLLTLSNSSEILLLPVPTTLGYVILKVLVLRKECFSQGAWAWPCFR